MPIPFGFIQQQRPPIPEALHRELCQPVLTGELGGEAVLLWGTETISVAAQAGATTVLCAEMGAVTLLEAARGVLMAENRPRAWELGELVPLIDLLGEEDPTELSDLIEGSRRGSLAQARKAAALVEPVRSMVLAGTMTLRHGEELAQLPQELLQAVLGSMERGSFSVRREILQMSVELYKRHREEDPGIRQRILVALSAPEPREALRELRYPSYSAARKLIDRFRERELKGTGLSLQEPPNLEGDTFSLVIPFSSREELEVRLRQAQAAAAEVDPITELLG